jgi:hypothetical protein
MHHHATKKECLIFDKKILQRMRSLAIGVGRVPAPSTIFEWGMFHPVHILVITIILLSKVALFLIKSTENKIKSF